MQQQGTDGQGTQPVSKLEPVVRESLTRKLDRTIDSSWAVHSVFGRFLYRIHWLDRGWLLEKPGLHIPGTGDRTTDLVLHRGLGFFHCELQVLAGRANDVALKIRESHPEPARGIRH